MPQAFPVEVPGGYWRDGARHRDAELRALTGGDEAFLAESAGSVLPVRRSTELLARTLLRIGPCRAVDERVVRSLTMGDREALLLHLRRITLGERVQAVVACPAPSCAERMDLDLDVGTLLLPPYSACQPRYELMLGRDGGTWHVLFRVPTGDDVEGAAALNPRDAGTGAARLLQACVEEVRSDSGERLAGIPEAVSRAVPAAMAERDPQAELTLRLECPRCGFAFVVDFDAAAFLMREVACTRARLCREVHRIASNYHWSEADILSLDAGRRRTYLALIDEAAGA